MKISKIRCKDPAATRVLAAEILSENALLDAMPRCPAVAAIQLRMRMQILTLPFFQEWPRQTKPKKGQFMNFSQGHSGTKVQCESCLFSQGKTPEFTKMGEIHELFVLALRLVWFAGATPDSLCKEV